MYDKNLLLFSDLVLNWYDNSIKRILPWHHKKTIYKIWISEMMLQRTKVSTVIPYFNKFIKNFPNVYKLSHSSLDEVMYFWSGLGYYARARYIHQTSTIIVKKYSGKFPEDFDTILKFPGIGKSTAGAILSFALNKPYPVLDSNVKRVLCRYFYIHPEKYKNKKKEKILWKLINTLLPKKRSSEFNQAMMDIGSTICASRKKCYICPLILRCKTKNNFYFFIKKSIKKNKKIFTKISWFLIIQDNSKVLLQKQPISGFWGGLFCFLKFDSLRNLKSWIDNFNLKIVHIKKFPISYHKFDHFILKIIPIHIQLSQLEKLIFLKENNILLYDLKFPSKIGLAKPVKNLLKNLSYFQ